MPRCSAVKPIAWPVSTRTCMSRGIRSVSSRLGSTGKPGRIRYRSGSPGTADPGLLLRSNSDEPPSAAGGMGGGAVASANCPNSVAGVA